MARRQRPADFFTDFKPKKKQRVRLTHNSNNENRNSHCEPPNVMTLRNCFNDSLNHLEHVRSKANDLESLILRWNKRMSELQIDKHSSSNEHNLKHIASSSRLSEEDLKIMAKITRQSKELLPYLSQFCNSSSKCNDILLDKLQHLKDQKVEQVQQNEKSSKSFK